MSTLDLILNHLTNSKDFQIQKACCGEGYLSDAWAIDEKSCKVQYPEFTPSHYLSCNEAGHSYPVCK